MRKRLVSGLIFVAIFSIFSTQDLSPKDRSAMWRKVRMEYLKEHPQCEVCGVSKDLQVHHVKPFQLFPSLELDKDNLVTLCTSKYWGINCHLLAGHGGDFRWYNRWIKEDIGILKVYANPDYIKEFGTHDLEQHIRIMKFRCKMLTMELKKQMKQKEDSNAKEKEPVAVSGIPGS